MEIDSAEEEINVAKYPFISLAVEVLASKTQVDVSL
jgi:hypothetical protein